MRDLGAEGEGEAETAVRSCEISSSHLAKLKLSKPLS